MHQVEDLWAEDRAGEELPDDGRLSEAREEAAEEPGRGEGEEDLQEDVGDRSAPWLAGGLEYSAGTRGNGQMTALHNTTFTAGAVAGVRASGASS